KIFIVESYFRNGHLIDGEWQYSIEACFEEFRLQFPDAALTYNTFHHNLKQCIQIFRETESNSVLQHRLNNLDELHEAIVAKIDEINNNPQMLANVSTGIIRRVRKCLEADGA
ncbi:unnamed protein product, partial [Tenebrio molitor]